VNAGDIYVFGMVHNETNVSIRDISVNVVLRAADGRIVNGGDSNFLETFLKLPPGGKSPFLISLRNAATGWVSYEFTPRHGASTQLVTPLEITRLEAYYDGSNNFHARGYVRNPNAFTVTYPEAHLVLYNSAQQVIGVEYVSLIGTILPAAGEVFFDESTGWSGSPNRSVVASFEVIAYGFGGTAPVAIPTAIGDSGGGIPTPFPADTGVPTGREPTPLP